MGRLGKKGGGIIYAGKLLTVRCPSMRLKPGMEGVCLQLKPETQ